MDGRITQLNNHPIASSGECVLYWMQKDQRAEDNWALLRAIELGNELGLPVVVGFIVTTGHKTANLRQYDFMLRGLADTARDLRTQDIGFVMRAGSAVDEIVKLATEIEASVVVTDQSQLNLGRQRRDEAAKKLPMRLEEVCANLIVPPSVVIDKAAFAAHQLRRRLEPLLEQYLVEYPAVSVDHNWTRPLTGVNDQDPAAIIADLHFDHTVPPASIPPGPRAGLERLLSFLTNGLDEYDEYRNDPTKSGTSLLSAYLHFGQLSAQRVALEVRAHTTLQNEESARSYLDELITWREIAANYTYYTQTYGTYDGAPAWAKKSLAPHAADPREFIYSYEEFEAAQTHDALWNAAQLEMVRTGRTHGYMRMYWSKKILEWTESPEAAIEIAVRLNDTYMLDGRDPNGYAGVMWAITGLHDRPWFDRPIFGQIRYMNDNGARKKFDVDEYISTYT